MTETTVAQKTNPYVEKLAHELAAIFQRNNGNWELEMAQHVYDALLVPKNAKIHDLHAAYSKLVAHVGRLERALERHNPGVCKQDEDPIDCAIRMLSPVRDDTPHRDRP